MQQGFNGIVKKEHGMKSARQENKTKNVDV